MKKFDVIVVGAGTGGCLTAKTVAKAGLKVCMIDQKPEQKIGDKVCGDAIGKHHFDTIKLAPPSGEELEQKIDGIKVYSPDMETVVTVQGEGVHGYLVNRQLFGQRLLKEAKDAGATLIDATIVTDAIIKNGFVTGVSVKDTETGEISEISAQAVVDASGHTAVLRKRLPSEFGIEAEVADEDVEVCYREIREVKEPIPELSSVKFTLIWSVFQEATAGFFPKTQTQLMLA